MNLLVRKLAIFFFVTLFVLPMTGPARGQGFTAPETIPIAAGSFIKGSDRAERQAAYALDEKAYGHSATRKGRWYENEAPRGNASVAAFAITRNVISNAAYAVFVRESRYVPPGVDAATWAGYGLIHPFERTGKFSWQGENPPPGREHHPVVLVSHADARAYARWLSSKTGHLWRLPGEAEWEKAARGTDGRRFPWGDDFDPGRLNSHDQGPFDTVPVGSFESGASPFGMLDASGQVFEWTSEAAGNGRFIVKGGSWDDKGCGICRPAARHSRAASLKHILIGFRLVTLLPAAGNQESY
ncbi:MAG: SUMF1/EgtB/PvdO family nonheme iron enzyme [Rhodospirillaceae bacterium]|nr:SUMF1/EgtB/PvdO family nonheme iron enzyme [Rhodospirillaceae bacterium]